MNDEVTQVTSMRERRVRLTQRDRELLAVLSIARYLTTAQVRELMYPGTDESFARKQLARLAGHRRRIAQPYLLRVAFYRSNTRDVAWALTPLGLAIARAVQGALDTYPDEVPSDDGLDDLTELNRLFVSLWRAEEGSSTKAASRRWTWCPSDLALFPWRDLTDKGAGEKLLHPHAVVGLVERRARWFVDVVPAVLKHRHRALHGKGGSFALKVDRFLTFLRSRIPGGSRSFYEQAFPDGFSPALVFLVRRSREVGEIAEALRSSGYASALERQEVLVGTAADLAGMLKRQAAAPCAQEPPPRVERPRGFPRLRRVERDALCSATYEGLLTIRDQRHCIRALPEDVRRKFKLVEPPYPKNTALVERLLNQWRAAQEKKNAKNGQ